MPILDNRIAMQLFTQRSYESSARQKMTQLLRYVTDNKRVSIL